MEYCFEGGAGKFIGVERYGDLGSNRQKTGSISFNSSSLKKAAKCLQLLN